MSEKRSWEAAREILHKVRAEDGAGSMFILANEIDAAEERGRRRGVEEGDELRTLLRDCGNALRIYLVAPSRRDEVDALLAKIDAALAPCDSGKEERDPATEDADAAWRDGEAHGREP